MLGRMLSASLEPPATERKSAPRTIDAYRRNLEPWVAFLDQQHAAMPGAGKSDPLLLRVYLRQRSEAGVSNRSLARFLSMTRAA